ncbi:MAG: glycosyltransferase [Bacteroidetes bacterium]|nr:glycosyltransferase [Bacteroidota bacterium]
MRIVVLTSRFPFPLEKGDKLRIYNQIKQLSKKNEIILIATTFHNINAEQLNELKKYCKTIHVFKINVLHQLINLFRALFNALPFQVGLFFRPSFKKQINKIIADTEPDAIYCHLIRMSEYVKDIRNIPKTLDYMDVFSKGMQRRAERSNYFMKQIALMEYRRLLKYEKVIFDHFDQKVIISEQDKELLPHPDRNKIHIIENGVDGSIFKPLITEKKYDLLFTGNMSYPPNIESAIYAATEILPEVHKINPNVNLLIAGINPSSAVRSLRSDKVHVVDNFKHIRDAFAMSRINLAPMLISIGLQNKILQAMAMKIPNICSSLANNAVKAVDGETIIEANTPEQYAQKITELLDNTQKATQIANKAYDFVLKRFDWEAQNERLERIILS